MAPSAERDLQRMVETFREKIVQCLIHGDYAKGGPYVLETLMLYIAVELFLRSDAEIGIWILLGKFSQLSIRCEAEIDCEYFLPRHYRPAGNAYGLPPRSETLQDLPLRS